MKFAAYQTREGASITALHAAHALIYESTGKIIKRHPTVQREFARLVKTIRASLGNCGSSFPASTTSKLLPIMKPARLASERREGTRGDPYGAPVLYIYRTVRNKQAPGGAEFVPELVHNQSGAGSQVLAVDLNKDGVTDLVTSGELGGFAFFGNPRAKK